MTIDLLDYEKRFKVVRIYLVDILRFLAVQAKHAISDRIIFGYLRIIACTNDVLVVLSQVLFVCLFISVQFAIDRRMEQDAVAINSFFICVGCKSENESRLNI